MATVLSCGVPECQRNGGLMLRHEEGQGGAPGLCLRRGVWFVFCGELATSRT
jgi:hypothetical protein